MTSGDEMRAGPKGRIQSLAKGLRLLLMLSCQNRALSLDELTQRSGFGRTTCFRLLQTMKDFAFVEQDQRSKRYRLGSRNIAVGAAAMSGFSLRSLAWPYMQRLRDETKETVNLCVLVGTGTVIVERLDAEYALASRRRVGTSMPTYASGGGKAILAFLPEESLEDLLARMEFVQYTEYTTTSVDQLKEELARVRAEGIAVCDQGLEKGLASMGCPLMDHTGNPIAAISLSFPLSRHSVAAAKKNLGPNLRHVCRELSAALGYLDVD